ncbi:MAG TPA: ABC transporter permease [Ohtaekwangia sp.]|uniref:ABC transporter permease n=1 Tax=Ohtaekwangia sp. TaxID=2066019 RepID=UPI002F95B282
MSRPHHTEHKPPALATRLLTGFLRDDLLEEVQGDLEEGFYYTARTKSIFKAKLHYWYEVLHYLRPFAIRKSGSQNLNHYAMFQNYFKIGWRNMNKQRMYSFIKVGGFALGVAACLLISLYIKDELSYDLHYPDADRIYRVIGVYNDNGEIEKGAWFQAPFANALKQDYPEIEKAGRYNSSELFGAGSNQIRRDDQLENTYEEGFVYADQELLEIFQIPMVYGNLKHCLDEPGTLVITKRKADKYFPNENPVGKLMVMNDQVKDPLKIGGVIQDFPSNSHLNFDFIVTMKGRQFWDGEQNYWGATNYPTYILVKQGTDVAQLEKKMNGVISKYMLPMWLKEERANAYDLAKKVSLTLQPVKDIHLRSAGIEDPLSHGDIRFVWLFGAIAIFILLLACVNFINLSTAKSANRAKEVGLRKTVGSMRSNIINQFLTESLLYSFFSFVLGMFIAWLLLPYFNMLASKHLEFPWGEWWFVPLMFAASIVIGLIAGIYPSFYLSSFKPIAVLKGNLSRGSKNATTRSALVVFQFTTSIALIIATVIIYRQVEYILNKKIGFEKDQVLLIQGTNTLGDKVKTFKDELLQLSQVKSATVSDYLPIRGTKRNGNAFWNDGKQKEEKSVGVQIWEVDPDYIKTLGMKIVDGRDFNRDIVSDSASIIINQKMAKELGLKDPIGRRVANWRPYTIIGVVEDFNFESLREEIHPLCFVLGNSPRIVSAKVDTQDMAGTLASIEAIWKKLSPHQPIRYTFLDESFSRMYDDVKRMGSIFTSFAILAIVVACLGLFALSAFMVEQRGKEISIRLVLGASLNSIFNLLTLNFIKLVLISMLIAAPLAWYMMQKWLEDFSYRTEITWDIFVLAGAMSILIALLTISYQSIRAALVKPVNNLRSE